METLVIKAAERSTKLVRVCGVPHFVAPIDVVLDSEALNDWSIFEGTVDELTSEERK